MIFFEASIHRYPRGARDVLSELRSSEGFSVFTRGATAILIRSFPANAVSLDQIKCFVHVRSSLFRHFFSVMKRR